MGELRSMDAVPNQLGVILYETLKDDEVTGYTQIFRNGAIEAILLLHAGGNDRRLSAQYEPAVRAAMSEYLKGLRAIGQEPPWQLGLTLLNVEGFAFQVDPIHELRRRAERFQDKNLPAPKQSIGDHPGDADKALKESFDYFWNTGGFVGSANFDESGNWRRR